MKRTTVALGMFAALALAACQTAAPSDGSYIRLEETTITDKRDELLTYIVDRPGTDGKYPLVVMVDGSGCRGWEASKLHTWFRPDETSPLPYARLFVLKRGVPRDSTGREGCSETFLKSYTMDNQVEDHLRVLQHVRAHADWWDGTLYVAGWSDGGDIATQLTAYYPNVTRAVLGAMGGGTTMYEQMRDIYICPPERFVDGGDRDSCIASIDAEFEEMRDNPTWKKTWSGDANTYRVWATRLDTRLTHLLKDMQTPVLIVHGEADKNVPVDSARMLVAASQEAGSSASVTYWEVPSMGHTPHRLAPEEKEALMHAMRDWLLLGEETPRPW